MVEPFHSLLQDKIVKIAMARQVNFCGIRDSTITLSSLSLSSLKGKCQFFHSLYVGGLGHVFLMVFLLSSVILALVDLKK